MLVFRCSTMLQCCTLITSCFRLLDGNYVVCTLGIQMTCSHAVSLLFGDLMVCGQAWISGAHQWIRLYFFRFEWIGGAHQWIRLYFFSGLREGPPLPQALFCFCFFFFRNAPPQAPGGCSIIMGREVTASTECATSKPIPRFRAQYHQPAELELSCGQIRAGGTPNPSDGPAPIHPTRPTTLR